MSNERWKEPLTESRRLGPGTGSGDASANSTLAASGRLEWLDAIRGISCLAVVLYHYTARFDEIYGHDFHVPYFLRAGSVGVLAFFIVSGFVISLTLNRNNSPVHFLFNRFARLYPTYWVALILTYLVVQLAGLPGREVTFPQFLANFTMLQEFIGIPHVDGAYWTLTVELIFYFWMFIVWRTGIIRQAPYILIGVTICSFLVSILEKSTAIAILSRLLLIDYGGLFFSGVVFYQIWSGQTRGAFASVSLVLSLISAFQGRGAIEGILIIGTYSIFFLISFRRLDYAAPRALVALGALTYSLYLIHQNIGYVLIRTLRPIIGDMLATVATLALCVVTAFFLRHWVEEPSLRRLRSWRESWQVRNVERQVGRS